MSFKHLFSRSLGADPERLHLAAHSHHLWPDASFDGQSQAWNDAARLADRKWDKVMGEVWPDAQAQVAAELGTGMPDAIVFASNTHDFLIRLASAAPRAGGECLRVLTSDGEFHSARRQFARWAEDGWLAARQGRRRAFRQISPSASSAAARTGDSRPDPGQPRAVRTAAALSTGVDELAALAPARRTVGRDRRLSRLHGASTRRSARCRSQVGLLPRRRL